MATVTRSTTWSDGQVLTAAALNAEFNNLLNAVAIVNADISAGAGIVYSKLSLTGSILNADISGSAAITESKILFSGSGHHHTGGTDGNLITVNRAFGFFIPGSPSVANDVSWDPVAPQSMTALKLWAVCKTAPTGANFIAQIYDVTQSRIVATVTITAGSTTGNNASMTNAAITQGDTLRADVTQVGSSVIGSDISLVLECSQP